MVAVIYKYIGKEEQRKMFNDFPSAMRFQGNFLKNGKKGLEYAKYDLNA